MSRSHRMGPLAAGPGRRHRYGHFVVGPAKERGCTGVDGSPRTPALRPARRLRDALVHPVSTGRCPMITVLLPAALLLLTLSTAVRARPAEPVFSDTGPEAAAYGATQGYPVPEPPAVRAPRQEEMVGWYRHYDRFRTMRT